MEEQNLEVDRQRDDEKMTLNDNNNRDAETPEVGESKMLNEECKEADAKIIDKENTAGNGDSPTSDSDNNEGRKKRKRRRRQKGGKNHRRWKPYDKMSWTEKQALEEKETRRATLKREEAFASGHPVAPYNTTQFLMDDHCKNEAISPDLHRHNSNDSKASNSSDTSSDFYEDDENDGFQEKNFMDTFNDFRMQDLMNKTKEDLVRDYVQLEMKLEQIENQHKSEDLSKSGSESDFADDSMEMKQEEADTNKMVDFSEYEKLKAENSKLKMQNKSLLDILESSFPKHVQELN